MTKATHDIMTKLLDGCPACGAPLHAHQDEQNDIYEYWQYDCEGDIVRHGDKLVVNERCQDALAQALAKMGGKRVVTTVIETA